MTYILILLGSLKILAPFDNDFCFQALTGFIRQVNGKTKYIFALEDTEFLREQSVSESLND